MPEQRQEPDTVADTGEPPTTKRSNRALGHEIRGPDEPRTYSDVGGPRRFTGIGVALAEAIGRFGFEAAWMGRGKGDNE